LTGFLQIRALQHHDEAIERADQWGALAEQIGPALEADAHVQVDRFRLYQYARIRSDQARAQAFLGVGPSVGEAALDAARWSHLAAQIRTDSSGLAARLAAEMTTIRRTAGEWLPGLGLLPAEPGGRCPTPPWASPVAPSPVRDGPEGAGPGQ